MKQVIPLLIFTILSSTVFAQDSTIESKTVLRTQIKTTDNAVHKGYLRMIDDSTLFLSTEKKHLLFHAILNDTNERLNYYNIKLVTTSNGKHRWPSFAICTVTGTAIGALVGHSAGDDPPKPWDFFRLTASDKAWIGGFLGICVGSLVGVLISKSITNRRRFAIFRKKELFREMKDQIISTAM